MSGYAFDQVLDSAHRRMQDATELDTRLTYPKAVRAQVWSLAAVCSKTLQIASLHATPLHHGAGACRVALAAQRCGADYLKNPGCLAPAHENSSHGEPYILVPCRASSSATCHRKRPDFLAAWPLSMLARVACKPHRQACQARQWHCLDVRLIEHAGGAAERGAGAGGPRLPGHVAPPHADLGRAAAAQGGGCRRECARGCTAGCAPLCNIKSRDADYSLHTMYMSCGFRPYLHPMPSSPPLNAHQRQLSCKHMICMQVAEASARVC